MTRKFSKSKKSSWSLGVVMGGSGVRHPPPPPQTLTRNISKSKKSSWSLGVVVGGVPASDTPPPPPQTMTRKFSKSKKSKKLKFRGGDGGGGSGVRHPPTTTTSNFDKKNFQVQKVKLSLGVVVGVGCLNITSTNSGTFYIWEDD